MKKMETESKKEKLGLELIKSAMNNDIERVNSLIKEGADVNFKEDEGITALMMADVYRYCDIVKMLRENGAKTNVRIRFFWTDLKINFLYFIFLIFRFLNRKSEKNR